MLIGAVGLIVALSIRQDHERIVSSAFSALDSQAIIAESKVEAVLRGIDVGLRHLVLDQDAESPLSDKGVSRRQLAFLADFPEVRTITAVDSSGRVMAAESIQTPEDLKAIRAFNISERDYFRFHRDAGRDAHDRMYLSRPFVGSSNRWIIVASRAIRGTKGEFRGVVVATVIPKFFEPILLEVMKNEVVDAAAIHDREGNVLYRLPDAEKHIGKNIAKGEAFQKYLQSESAITRYLGLTVTDNLERALVFAKVGNTGLDVGVSARYDRMVTAWYPALIGKILLYCLFILAIIAFRRQWLRRQQAAIALSESEIRFRHLFDQAPIALSISDRDGRILLTNREFEVLFGYRSDELPTVAAFRQHVYADAAQRELQAQAVEESWRKVSSGGHPPAPVELPVVCKDGSRKMVLLSRQKLGDGMLVAFVDITSLREAEGRVQELSQVVEQSPEAVFIVDLAARILYVNDAFVAASGYERDELIGQDPRMLKSQKTPEATFKALWESLAQGRVWSGELVNQRKDGSECVVFAVISPMRDSDGQITRYVAIEQDITEKKRLGLELDRHRYHLQELVDERTHELEVAKTKAEAANVAKSAFLANMSHEIRTPMNGVLGMAYLLRRTGLNAKQSVYLDKIEASGKHLMSVINDILDLSKIEAGKLELDVTNFKLDELVKELTDIVGVIASSKGLEWEVDIGDAPQYLRGDRVRLRQALMNYLSNAIKFTEKGSITLRCRTHEADSNGYRLRFEVSDSGAGIHEEDFERLFKSFEQGDKSITRQFGGTGLGLAITKHIVELMEGEVGARSTVGQGSTFWLSVRLGHGSAPPESDGEPPVDSRSAIRSSHTGRRILIVEDNLVNYEAVAMLMEDVGLVVERASTGLEAIEKVKQGGYALILMDVQMPTLDGIGATKMIRQLENGMQVPILAITANAFREDREACLAAGMNDFVGKPFEPDRLYAIVLKWLNSLA